MADGIDYPLFGDERRSGRTARGVDYSLFGK
jgi:hypothetical protein